MPLSTIVLRNVESTSQFQPTILQRWMKRDLQRDLDQHSLNIIIINKEKLQKVATSQSFQDLHRYSQIGNFLGLDHPLSRSANDN